MFDSAEMPPNAEENPTEAFSEIAMDANKLNEEAKQNATKAFNEFEELLEQYPELAEKIKEDRILIEKFLMKIQDDTNLLSRVTDVCIRFPKEDVAKLLNTARQVRGDLALKAAVVSGYIGMAGLSAQAQKGKDEEKLR